MAAQPEMEVIAAGAANPSRETKADRSAPAAKADGARPTAKAVAHASIAAATKAVAHASIAAAAKTNAVTAAAAKAKTYAVAAASAAGRGGGVYRCSQLEGKRRHGRQEKSVHHLVIHAFRLPISSIANAPKLWGFPEKPARAFLRQIEPGEQKAGQGAWFLLTLRPRLAIMAIGGWPKGFFRHQFRQFRVIPATTQKCCSREMDR
jgi:hypothetical protein